MRKGRRQTLKGGSEYDVTVKGWRRAMCYLSRAGVAKKIKRKMNKRARQEAKKQMENEYADIT